ncbi:MAG TPA: SH3 domain-containing protein [Anaerolineae bacterium]|nr:SH3 domain-containing protein [Anaerolineae bacterium]
MPSYDAGPGDWSDRDWESPDHKPATQAKRRLTLPPWLLVTAAVVIAILLCVALVLIVRALRAQPEVTPTAENTVASAATSLPDVMTTSTPITAILPTEPVSPTATVVIPGVATPSPVVYTEIAAGAQVTVQGTGGRGLNIRVSPTTSANLTGSAKDGDVLTVLEGPREADGYTWWKVRTEAGKEGWAAANFLALKPQ